MDLSGGHDQPKKKVTLGRTQVKMDLDEEGSSSPMQVGNVSAMTVKMKEELEMHRMRGHIPFMSECPHCRMTRGVTQHRRGKGVERAVRSMKELFSAVRLDLRAQGYDIKRSPRAFELGLIYCAATIIIRLRLMEESPRRSWCCNDLCQNVDLV